jgi:hypothetical protein
MMRKIILYLIYVILAENISYAASYRPTWQLSEIGKSHRQTKGYTMEQLKADLESVSLPPVDLECPPKEMTLEINGVNYPIRQGDVVVISQDDVGVVSQGDVGVAGCVPWLVVFEQPGEVLNSWYDSVHGLAWRGLPHDLSPISWLEVQHIRRFGLEQCDDARVYKVFGTALGSIEDGRVPLVPLHELVSKAGVQVEIWHIIVNEKLNTPLHKAISKYCGQRGVGEGRAPLWALMLLELAKLGIIVGPRELHQGANPYMIRTESFTPEILEQTHRGPITFENHAREQTLLQKLVSLARATLAK